MPNPQGSGNTLYSNFIHLNYTNNALKNPESGFFTFFSILLTLKCVIMCRRRSFDRKMDSLLTENVPLTRSQSDDCQLLVDAIASEWASTQIAMLRAELTELRNAHINEVLKVQRQQIVFANQIAKMIDENKKMRTDLLEASSMIAMTCQMVKNQDLSLIKHAILKLWEFLGRLVCFLSTVTKLPCPVLPLCPLMSPVKVV